MSHAEVISLRAYAPEEQLSPFLKQIQVVLKNLAVYLYKNTDLSASDVNLLFTPFLNSEPFESIPENKWQRFQREVTKVHASQNWSTILIQARKSLVNSNDHCWRSIPFVGAIGHLSKKQKQKLLVYFCLIIRALQ